MNQLIQAAWDDWNKDVDVSKRILLPTVTFVEAFRRGYQRGVKERENGF